MKEQIIGFFEQTSRLTLKAIENNLHRQRPEITRAELRAAISVLLDEGRLRYTHRYGISQLERNYERLHRVSERIWLAPEGLDCPAPPGGEVLVRLSSGASFGYGDHPTTRLALKAVDLALKKLGTPAAALDIGTGTGILALAAVSLGAESAIALDIDPLACREARVNVSCNGLGERIAVRNQAFEALSPAVFQLVMANLRPPTLSALFERMHQQTAPYGMWVLSGFRCHEMQALRSGAENEGRAVLWQQEAEGWGALLLKCPPKP